MVLLVITDHGSAVAHPHVHLGGELAILHHHLRVDLVGAVGLNHVDIGDYLCPVTQGKFILTLNLVGVDFGRFLLLDSSPIHWLTVDQGSVLGVLHLLLQRLDQNVHSFLKLLDGSRHEEMVEATSGVSLKSMLDLLPVTVAVLVGQAEKHDIGLFREVLRLLDHVDEHFLNWPLISCHFLLDKDRGLPLKAVHGVGPVQLLLDVGVIVQGLNALKEHFEVVIDLLGRLGPDMGRDGFALLPWVQFQRLADLLVVSPIPIRETALKQDLLLDSLLFRKVHIVDPLEVAAVLRLELLFNQLFEALRVVEEAIVLHYLQLLLLGVL